jgi:deoxyribodipyrimidine photo-lyase
VQDGLPADAPPLSPFATVRAVGANAGAGALPSPAALGAADLAPLFTALGLRATDVSFPGGIDLSAWVASASSEPEDAGVALGPPTVLADKRGVLTMHGGETAALARIRHYATDTTALRTYKETRNGMLGADYSSKLSPWLAAGCVSPRTVLAAVRAHEAAHGANDSTYWLLFELLWRDYFRLAAGVHGARFFSLSGVGPTAASAPGASATVWGRDPSLRTAWCLGRTGYPFVDACMRELLLTGFMSNRGRQNVASFLARDLALDWRIGAAWFEALLIDHDPCSNYGNWAYVAGVGADPRESRYFLIPKQARTYDPDGAFMRTWLPELARVSTDALIEPARLPTAVRAVYPAPVVALLAYRQPFASAAGEGGGGGGGGGSGSSAQRGGRGNRGGRGGSGAQRGGRGDGVGPLEAAFAVARARTGPTM